MYLTKKGVILIKFWRMVIGHQIWQLVGVYHHKITCLLGLRQLNDTLSDHAVITL